MDWLGRRVAFFSSSSSPSSKDFHPSNAGCLPSGSFHLSLLASSSFFLPLLRTHRRRETGESLFYRLARLAPRFSLIHLLVRRCAPRVLYFVARLHSLLTSPRYPGRLFSLSTLARHVALCCWVSLLTEERAIELETLVEGAQEREKETSRPHNVRQ